MPCQTSSNSDARKSWSKETKKNSLGATPDFPPAGLSLDHWNRGMGMTKPVGQHMAASWLIIWAYLPDLYTVRGRGEIRKRGTVNTTSASHGTELVPMAEQTERDARPCIYLTALIELCLCEHSPVELLCSFFTMCWFWPDCVKEGKDIFLNSALLTLHRLLQNKLARLLEEIAACVACQNVAEGSVFMVPNVFVFNMRGIFQGCYCCCVAALLNPPEIPELI